MTSSLYSQMDYRILDDHQLQSRIPCKLKQAEPEAGRMNLFAPERGGSFRVDFRALDNTNDQDDQVDIMNLLDHKGSTVRSLQNLKSYLMSRM